MASGMESSHRGSRAPSKSSAPGGRRAAWRRRGRVRAGGGGRDVGPAGRRACAPPGPVERPARAAPTSGPGRARGSRRARQRRPADPLDPSGGRYGRGGRSGGPARPGAVAPVRPHPAREGCGKRGQQVRRVAGSAGGRRAVRPSEGLGVTGRCHDLSPRTFPTPKSRSIVAPREEGEEPPRLRGHR